MTCKSYMIGEHRYAISEPLFSARIKSLVDTAHGTWVAFSHEPVGELVDDWADFPVVDHRKQFRDFIGINYGISVELTYRTGSKYYMNLPTNPGGWDRMGGVLFYPLSEIAPIQMYPVHDIIAKAGEVNIPNDIRFVGSSDLVNNS